MHRNPYWIVFLTIIGLIVLAYTGYTFFNIYEYSSLTQKTAPQSIQWSINKLDDDNFVLFANYAFNWDGKNYTGKVIRDEHYLNAWATREALEGLNKGAYTVWFDPANPQNSTLFKSFPLKQSIYAAVLWLLFFYFLWLGYSVKRYTL